MAQKKHTGWERAKKRRTQMRIEKARLEREARQAAAGTGKQAP